MHFPKQAIVAVLILAVICATAWFVTKQRAADRSVLSGFFESQPTDVSSRIGGKVSKILVKEGDPVRRGQVLVILDAAPDQITEVSKAQLAQQLRQQYIEMKDGPRPGDILKQRAGVSEANADLQLLLNGPRPEEVRQAKAVAAAAYANYAASLRGPTAEARSEAQARYDSAVASETLARLDVVRYTKLFAGEAVTKQQFDQVKEALSTASANCQDMFETLKRAKEGTPADELEASRQTYLQAKAALDLVLAGPRIEDIAASRAHLAQAQIELEELIEGNRPEDIKSAKLAYLSAVSVDRELRALLADRVVKAPFDGVVDNVPVSEGDLVTADADLVRIEDPSDIWIKVYVPETHLADVTPGVKAVIKVDGITGNIAGVVESVAAHGEFTPANLQSPDERGMQVFATRLRLKTKNALVKAGMDATVTQIGAWTP
jgi:HlyD family secretion protein